MTCHSCGGIIGRDCFNPQECAEISHMQEQEQRGHLAGLDEIIRHLVLKVQRLEARVSELEKLHPLA